MIGAPSNLELLGKRMHVAFVVDDMEAGIAFWTQAMSLKRFLLIESDASDRKVVYRGAVTKLDMSIAYSYLGETLIELLAPRGDAPSLYADFLTAGNSGLHHLGFWPEEFDRACAELESSGFKAACTFFAPTGEVNAIYYDSPSAVGTMVELVRLTKEREQLMPKMQQLVETSDEPEKVIRFRNRSEFVRRLSQ